MRPNDIPLVMMVNDNALFSIVGCIVCAALFILRIVLGFSWVLKKVEGSK